MEWFKYKYQLSAYGITSSASWKIADPDYKVLKKLGNSCGIKLLLSAKSTLKHSQKRLQNEGRLRFLRASRASINGLVSEIEQS